LCFISHIYNLTRAIEESRVFIVLLAFFLTVHLTLKSCYQDMRFRDQRFRDQRRRDLHF
jgi:hypothetical protein